MVHREAAGHMAGLWGASIGIRGWPGANEALNTTKGISIICQRGLFVLWDMHGMWMLF